MQFLSFNIFKFKNSFCPIFRLFACLGRLRLIRLGLIRLGLIALTSLSPVLSAATVDDLTFTLINEGTEYAVTDCADSATGTLTIPETYEGKPVTEIGANAFYESKLTAVELPNGLESIRSFAFYASSIESIDLPASLNTLGEAAFSSCSALSRTVTLPSGVTEIPSYLFYNCQLLAKVILHDAITSIGASAFATSKLQSIHLPAGLTSIGARAFSNCSALTGSVTLPSGVTEIPDYLFDNTALTEVILHDAVTSIGAWAFYSTDITAISLPSSLRTIGANAFFFSDLQSITLPAGLTALGDGAFRYTYNLAEVRLEGAAPSLGADVFREAGRDVAGGTEFLIYDSYQASYENSADWSNFAFTVLADPNVPVMEAFVLSTSLDASNNRFSIHSHGEPSAVSASVLVQHRSSLKQGEWTAVDSADVTESRDSTSGVVTRSLSLSPSTEEGGAFYRLHYEGSASGGAE